MVWTKDYDSPHPQSSFKIASTGKEKEREGTRRLLPILPHAGPLLETCWFSKKTQGQVKAKLHIVGIKVWCFYQRACPFHKGREKGSTIFGSRVLPRFHQWPGLTHALSFCFVFAQIIGTRTQDEAETSFPEELPISHLNIFCMVGNC